MKIPPLTDIEPVPPVPELPSCSHAATVSGEFDEICEEPPFDSDDDADIDDDIIAGISAAVETGSMLDMEMPKVLFNILILIGLYKNAVIRSPDRGLGLETVSIPENYGLGAPGLGLGLSLGTSVIFRHLRLNSAADGSRRSGGGAALGLQSRYKQFACMY